MRRRGKAYAGAKGRFLEGYIRPKAEALGYLEARAEAGSSLRNDRKKGKGEGKGKGSSRFPEGMTERRQGQELIQGSLRYALGASVEMTRSVVGEADSFAALRNDSQKSKGMFVAEGSGKWGDAGLVAGPSAPRCALRSG